MKNLKVYERSVLERTGYRKYPYKEVTQYVVSYNDKVYKNGHYEDVHNPRLKVKFKEVLNTRKKTDVTRFLNRNCRTESFKWLKSTIKSLD